VKPQAAVATLRLRMFVTDGDLGYFEMEARLGSNVMRYFGGCRATALIYVKRGGRARLKHAATAGVQSRD